MTPNERMKVLYSFIAGLVIGALCYWHFAPTPHSRERVRIVVDTAYVVVPAVAEKKVMLPARLVYRDSLRVDTVYGEGKYEGVVSAQSVYEDSVLTAGIIYYFEPNEFMFRYSLKPRKISYLRETHYIEKEYEWYERFGVFGGVNFSGGAVVGVQYRVSDWIYLGIYKSF